MSFGVYNRFAGHVPQTQQAQTRSANPLQDVSAADSTAASGTQSNPFAQFTSPSPSEVNFANGREVGTLFQVVV